MPTYRYRAFISYSHSDRRWAKWLHRTLERYRTPRHLVGRHTDVGKVPPQLTPIFRDREELASAPDLSQRINEALTASENLIVICSPRAATSRWVNEEIATFKRLGRSERIFALIVDGEPGLVGEPESCFPPAMVAAYSDTGVQLEGITEPVAADLRARRDGRNNARLKLIAGLLGVGLDDLRQRELQRRHRRMAAITTTSIAAMAITIALAISAMLARDEAEQRRAQAEDLLGFMVGDLRERLEPIGRLDVLQALSDKAMNYFATVPVTSLTENELTHQARIMTHLGEIRIDQLRYEDALAAFTHAFERSAILATATPGDGQRLYDRAQAEFWVAFVHWRRGALGEARVWLTHYRDSSIELAGMNPLNIQWQQEVAYGHHNLAVLDLEAGSLAEAATGFEQTIISLQALQRLEHSVDRRRDIADADSWLGNIAMRQGDLNRALLHYERSMQELAGLSDLEPDNRQRRYDEGYAMQLVAEVLAIVGERQRALALSEAATAIFDPLIIHDPDNLEWRRASTLPKLLKGELLLASGDPSGARALADEALATIKILQKTATADYRLRDQAAEAYMLLALTEREVQRHSESLGLTAKALENFTVIIEGQRMNAERTGRLASLHVLRGNIQAAMNEIDLAQASWRTAYELLRGHDVSAQSVILADPWVRVLTYLGDHEEAAVIQEVLESRNYRPLQPWSDPPACSTTRC